MVPSLRAAETFDDNSSAVLQVKITNPDFGSGSVGTGGMFMVPIKDWFQSVGHTKFQVLGIAVKGSVLGFETNPFA